LSKQHDEVEQRDQYIMIYARDHGICRTCGESVAFEEGQRAHRIAQSGTNLNKYGGFIIHHPMNLALTHAGACNDAQNIGNRDEEVRELVSAIEQAIIAEACMVLADPGRRAFAKPVLAALANMTRRAAEGRVA
jgi:hypothetical protein